MLPTLALLLTLSAPPDAIRLQPRFTPGQVEGIEVTAEYFSGAGSLGPATLQQHFILRATTAAVDATGVATVRVTFDEFHAKIDDPTPASPAEAVGPFIWDWTRPAAPQAPPADAPQPEPQPDAQPDPQPEAQPAGGGDGAGGEAQPNPPPPRLAVCAELVRCTLELRIAPDGSVTEISGLEPVLRAQVGRRMGQDTSRVPVFGFFGPSALTENLSAIWSIDPDCVETERKRADTWSRTQLIPLFGEVRLAAATEFTLASISDDAASIEGTVKFQLHPPRGEPSPIDPTARLIDQSGAAWAIWDIAKAHIRERSWDRNFTWTATLKTDPPIESQGQSRASVMIRRLE